jgi:hypothetical protein
MRSNPLPILQNDDTYTPLRSAALIAPSDVAEIANGPSMGMIFNATVAQPAAVGNVLLLMADGSWMSLYITANWFGVQYLQVRQVYSTAAAAISAGCPAGIAANNTTFNGAIYALF